MRKKKLLTSLIMAVLLLSLFLIGNGKTDEETKKRDNNQITEQTQQELEENVPFVVPEKALLDVPLELQGKILPTGCEIVSASMMINYYGIKTTGTSLAKEIPYDERNPSLGYVGSPFTTGGWTIYPEALATTVVNYIPTARDMTGMSLDDLKEQIAGGKPVLVWMKGMHGYIIHSIIVTGYDEKGIFYNDPLKGKKNDWLDYEDFLEMWSGEEYRSLSY